MTKLPLVDPDPLVMKVRKALKALEARPEPTEFGTSPYGHKQCKCPVCGEWQSMRKGSYNHHWTLMHGTPFWREKAVIKLLKRELK